MKQTICVIGSGWGASSFIKNIDTEKYDVVVISKNENFIYTPLLPYSIFKNINLKCHINTINDKVTYVKNNVSDVNFNDNKVLLDNSKEIKYDIIVFSHGAIVNTFNIDGVDKYSQMLKSCEDIEYIQHKLKNVKENANIVVIGCGPTGVETIGYLMDQQKFNIFALDALDKPISMYPKESIDYLLDCWKNKHVTSYFNAPVTKITNKKIITPKNEIDYDMAIWCGGIKPNNLSNKILSSIGIVKSPGIPVNNFLQIKKKDGAYITNSYAIGDCSLGFGPPTAQKASQQGYYLANKFNNNHGDKFNYQNKGQIVYIGDSKSMYTNHYFNLNGRISYFLNKCIMVYNSINFKQMKEICKSYIEK